MSADAAGPFGATAPGLVADDLMLNPSARVLWRSPRCVQVELGTRAILVDGVDRTAVLRLLGRRDPAHTGGAASPPLRDTLDALGRAGFLVRRPGPPRLPPDPANRPLPRLGAEHAALRSRYGDLAAPVLSRRRRSAVGVEGATRVAGLIGPLLAAAGVGRVLVQAPGDARLGHAAPGGITPADEGRRFMAAATAAIHSAAPECDTSVLPPGMRPDLVVLAVDGPVDVEVRTNLHDRGCAHLVATTGPDHGIVGPLVLPGRSSCLHCADRHRLDRDVAWTALAVQLAVPSRSVTPSDVGLSTLVAAVTTQQVLALLDGQLPSSVQGTLEMHLPDWRIRRRTWPPHPDCACGAAATPSRRPRRPRPAQ